MSIQPKEKIILLWEPSNFQRTRWKVDYWIKDQMIVDVTHEVNEKLLQNVRYSIQIDHMACCKTFLCFVPDNC